MKTEHKKPMTGKMAAALNPVDVAEKLRRLRLRHFIGSRDTVVEGATRASGWRERWETMLVMLSNCPGK